MPIDPYRRQHQRLRWAPDSSAIVLSANRFGRYDIYKVSRADGETVRLTDDRSTRSIPVSRRTETT